jgi:hypothetical protein
VNEYLARRIAAILATADHGCHVCAGRLAEEAERMFPGFEWARLVNEAGEWTS